MQDRIVMNTASLQKHFSSVYEEFFSKNDLVVSVTNSFPWNIGFRENKRQIHIKQKVPTKTYIGVSSKVKPGVEFGSVKIFDILDHRFENILFSDINKKYKEIESLLGEMLTASGYMKGIIISFLSENPRGHGFGFSGASATLLSSAIYLLLEKLTKKDLGSYGEFVNSPLFEQVFNLAWQIDDLSKYGYSIANNSYVSMANTHLPTITLCDEAIVGNTVNVTNLKYTLKDFFNIQNNIEDLHLDYGMIFSGAKNKVESNHQIYNNSKEDFIKLQESMCLLLKDTPLSAFPVDKSFFSILKDCFFVFNFKLIDSFKSLLEKGFDDGVIHEFIQTIKENNVLGSLFEKENKLFSAIYFWFDSFKKFDDELLAVFPVNSIKAGGSFVFVMKHKKSRETLQKTLYKLREIGYTDLVLEYASWLDGSCSDGIVLEQFIHKGIFSHYVAKDQVFYKNNQGETYIGNYNEIIATYKEGLLLDMLHNRIYLNGRKLSSKDIPSQTTTINIMEKLIENIGQDISNNQIDISSYSKNKNEMLGKIILPLISLLEKETGKVLPLICKGSIYDFYIKLNQSDLKISLVKKI